LTDGNYEAIFQASKFTERVDAILEAGLPFGFDIESGYTGEDKDGTALLTFHPDWIMVGFSFTNSLNWSRYVPLAHDSGENVDDVVQVARDFWRLLQSGLGVAHNASFELKGISRWFREVLGNDPILGEEVTKVKGFFPIRSDTMIEAHMAGVYPPANTPGIGVGIGLKSVTKAQFGHQMVEFKDLFPVEDTDKGPGTKKARLRFIRFNTRNVTPEIVEYACEDAVWCLAIHLEWFDKLSEEQALILKMENQLLPVLIEMEIEGMHLDWATIHAKMLEVKDFQDLKNEEILAELSERLGETININLGSPKQLAEILYNRLGLPVKERSEKTNEPSTSEKALRAIAKVDPVIKSILEYREIAKLYGSYLKKYDEELNYAGTGRAHPNHNQVGTVTGRMSVDGVSYQQWPKPYHYDLKDGTTLDLNYRDLLTAPTEYRIVGYDFSQVELRVLAGMANERAMLEAFESGVDIHVATAANMLGIRQEDVTDKQRSMGKTLNFAVVYGSGANNIAELISTPENPVTAADAQILLDKYFAAFPGLKRWMDTTVAHGREEKTVSTLFGRKFTVWEYMSNQDWIRAKGDRMCVNAPVQGGAADYMKLGMIRVNKAIKKAGLQDKIRLVMTIHDALEFYVHKSVSTQEVIDLVNPEVSFRVKGLPEIRADWHEGNRWGSVVDLVLDEDKRIQGYKANKKTFATIEEAYHEAEHPVVKEKEPEPVEPKHEPTVVPDDDAPVWEKAPAPVWGVNIQTVDSPTEDAWERFEAFLAAREVTEGTFVQVTLPDGEIRFDGFYNLTVSDQPQVSLILGGARLTTLNQVNEGLLEEIPF
jgi:DNA polymerase I-like protein with 3'-5' exonuclease and polymerase domains